jgi:hypothetical protein
LKDFSEQKGIKLTIGMRFESISAMLEAVQRNMGIAVSYEENIRSAELKFLKIRGLHLDGHSYIVYANNKRLSKSAFDFLDLLRRSRPGIGSVLPASYRDHSIVRPVLLEY